MELTDYVSYPLALSLKKVGFDELCDHYYCAFDNETDVRFWSIHPAQSQNGFVNPDGKVIADAPSLYAAQKWLREKMRISIRVNYIFDGKRWFADLLNLDSEEYEDIDESYLTYEDALSTGIYAACNALTTK